MDMAEKVPATGWRASLDLGFERRGARSVLAERRHEGPLVVQKSLHPEGEGICHAIVVHPPAGIAGGDELSLVGRAGRNSRVVLGTPGAARWYRSSGAWARQDVEFDIRENAALEWLPQETIFFDGAMAQMQNVIRVADGGCYLGWEILCFGRNGAGAPLKQGEFKMHSRVEVDGRPVFVERGEFRAGGALFASRAGLGGKSVCATLLAASAACDAALVAACRALSPASGECGVTLLPGVLVARYLGDSSESAKNYFIQLRRILRPAMMKQDATDLRIWST